MRTFFKKLIIWAMKEKATNEQVKATNEPVNDHTILPEGRLGPHPKIQMNKFVRFQVYAANGGLVIESIKYDHSTHDEPKVNLYVVTSHDDLPNQLAKIITYDNLVR